MDIKRIKELAEQKEQGIIRDRIPFYTNDIPGVQLVINGHTIFFEKETREQSAGEEPGGVYVHIDGVLRGYFDLNNDPFFRVYEGPEGGEDAGAVEWTKGDRAVFITE